jgi:mannose-6-phosphate isomerase-like protein (cupin superfamily)
MYVTPINSDNEPIKTETGEIIYELIGKTVRSTSGASHSLARIIIPPGKSSALHYHKVSQESYFILQGEGQMQVEGKEYTLTPGQACLIEPEEIHLITNQGEVDLVFLAICVPAWVPGDSFEIKS